MYQFDDGFGALFVDDLAAVEHHKNAKKTIQLMNRRFRDIYNWSLANRIVFCPKKFQLLDLSLRSIQENNKRNVRFGKTRLTWSSTAKYLGVLIDSKLTMKPQLQRIIKRAKESQWRVYNHTCRKTGSSARSTLLIYRTWILPIIDYGSATWIFRVKPEIGLDKEPSNGYRTLWHQLNRIHIGLIKSCLGLNKPVFGLSALVISGMMPLDYHLAYRAATFYYKIQNRLAGTALTEQYHHFKADEETWKLTSFYQPCEHFIQQMNKHSEQDLLGMQSVTSFQTELKRCIYKDLTMFWQQTPHGKATRELRMEWNDLKQPVAIQSRRAETMYYQMLSGKDDLGKQWLPNIQTKCKLCDQPLQTTFRNHIFQHCECLNGPRTK